MLASLAVADSSRGYSLYIQRMDQWLKWSSGHVREAGGGAHQVGANPVIPIPHPTNLALGLFGHKITLYRFNHTIAGEGAQTEQGAAVSTSAPSL